MLIQTSILNGNRRLRQFQYFCGSLNKIVNKKEKLYVKLKVKDYVMLLLLGLNYIGLFYIKSECSLGRFDNWYKKQRFYFISIKYDVIQMQYACRWEFVTTFFLYFS